MAQAVETPETLHVASGAGDAFATVWTFERADEVRASVRVGAAVVEMALGEDFDVAAGDWLNDGADVVFRAGRRPPAGATVRLWRRTALAQPFGFGDQARFSPEANERAFDRMVRVAQELDLRADQSVAIVDPEALAAVVGGVVTDQLPGLIEGQLPGLVDGLTDFTFDPSVVPSYPEGTLAAALRLMDQQPTGAFFAEDGARIQRLADRVFIGSAGVYDGKHFPDQHSWVSDPGLCGGIYTYLETRASVICNVEESGIAFSANTRSSSSAGAHSTGIGYASLAVLDTSTEDSVWNFYATAVRLPGAMGYVHNFETDVANLGDPVPLFPGNINALGRTSGISIASGGEPTVVPATAGMAGTASVALVIACNDPMLRANFDKAIIIHNHACAGTNGTPGSGEGTAIAFANHHWQRWYENDTNRVMGSFGHQDDVFYLKALSTVFQGPDNTAQVVITSAANAVRQVTIRGSDNTGPPSISATGAEPNMGLRLNAKGTGKLFTNADGLRIDAATFFINPTGGLTGVVVDNNQVALRPFNAGEYRLGSASHPFQNVFAGGFTFASGARLLSGTGNPNGVVAGNRGDLFLNSDGVQPPLWTKADGTPGSTSGWRQIYFL